MVLEERLNERRNEVMMSSLSEFGPNMTRKCSLYDLVDFLSVCMRDGAENRIAVIGMVVDRCIFNKSGLVS